jgi:hypothetical protein
MARCRQTRLLACMAVALLGSVALDAYPARWTRENAGCTSHPPLGVMTGPHGRATSTPNAVDK